MTDAKDSCKSHARARLIHRKTCSPSRPIAPNSNRKDLHYAYKVEWTSQCKAKYQGRFGSAKIYLLIRVDAVMRSLVCLLLLVSTCAVCLAADAFSRLNSALKNEDSIRFYSNCFLDKGPCSGDARAIKWLLPDLVATSCGRCSTKQKRAACRVISILQQKKHAETWNALLNKFDPNAIYRKNLDSFNSNCEEKFKIVVSDEEDETANASDSSAAVSSGQA